MFKSYDASSGVSLRSSKVGNLYLTHTQREREADWVNYDTSQLIKSPHTHTAQDSDELSSC